MLCASERSFFSVSSIFLLSWFSVLVFLAGSAVVSSLAIESLIRSPISCCCVLLCRSCSIRERSRSAARAICLRDCSSSLSEFASWFTSC